MTVYVDETREHARVSLPARRWGRLWCHMTADTEAELHEMAKAIGLKRAYFQRRPGPNRALDHYDLTPSKRAMAVKRGAAEESLQQFMHRTKGSR